MKTWKRRLLSKLFLYLEILTLLLSGEGDETDT